MEVTTSTPKRGRLVELDILRFFAASAVVLYHYQPRLKSEIDFVAAPWVEWVARFGYLGVDLFFLISGYVIVMSASGRSARSFLVHRIVRLYPSFWIALAVTIAAIGIGMPEQAHPSLAQIVANITMLPAYLSQERIDEVYWTLAVEWKFYFLVATIIALGYRARIEIIAYIWLSLLALQATIADAPAVASITIFPSGSYFAVGVLLYLTRENGVNTARATALLIGGGLCLFTAARNMPGFIQEPNPNDTIVVVSIVSAMLLVLFATVLRKSQIRPSRPLQVLGSMTYPLYLLHCGLGYVLIAAWRPFSSVVASIIAGVTVVMLVSLGMALFVEIRLISWVARSELIRKLTGEQRLN